nr:MAG: replication initiator protein [Microvirus sp.]
MYCLTPYRNAKGQLHGCGGCRFCRVKTRVRKAARIMLESFGWKDISFGTLTYNDENLPYQNSLCIEHHTLFMKAFRERLDARIRFVAVGEYGDSGSRGLNPHYHYIWYGYAPCTQPHMKPFYAKKGLQCPCPQCGLVADVWKKGNCTVDSFNGPRANYIAGYTVKKLTKKDDSRLEYITPDGHIAYREPEFYRASNRPYGIGANAVEEIALALQTPSGQAFIETTGDIPLKLKQNGRELTLDRYIRRKIREHLGWTETGAQPGWEQKQKETLFDLYAKYGITKADIKDRSWDSKFFLTVVSDEKNKLDLIKEGEINYSKKGKKL